MTVVGSASDDVSEMGMERNREVCRDCPGGSCPDDTADIFKFSQKIVLILKERELDIDRFTDMFLVKDFSIG